MSLFFAANLFVILKSLNAILVAGLIVIGLRKLQSRPQKITFIIMLLFFLSSTLFFNENEIRTSNDWLKHVLFFIGQFFFFLFLYYIIRLYFRKEEQKESSQQEHADMPRISPSLPPSAMGADSTHSTSSRQASSLPVAGFGMGTVNWFAFLTEQGLQHILVLPFFLLIVIIVRVQYLSIESRHFRQALDLFLWAGLSLMMIHTAEFIVENQNLIPSLADKIEVIEFLLFYLGILFLYLGMKKLS